MGPPVASVMAAAFVCPWCGAAVPPARADEDPARTCSQCSKSFLLVAGWSADSQVRPYHPQEHRPGFKLKVPGLVLMKQVELEAHGFAWGDLDPVVGMGSNRVQYPEVVSFAAWRSPNVTRLVVALAIGAPLTLLTLWAGIAEGWGWLIPAVGFALLTAAGVYRALRPGVLRLRLVSARGEESWAVRRPGWGAESFVLEAVRRITTRKLARLP